MKILNIIRSTVLTLSLAIPLLSYPVHAQAYIDAVRDGVEELITVLQKDQGLLKKQPGKVYEIANDVISPRFDFKMMSQWVMGRTWRDATPQQREEFTKQFKELLINTYAGALLEYSDEKVVILDQPKSKADAKDVTVKTQVTSKKRKPLTINYALHKTGNQWLVYDVAIEGVSIVTNYRASIAEEIRNKGIDGMIQTLADKNKKMRSK